MDSIPIRPGAPEEPGPSRGAGEARLGEAIRNAFSEKPGCVSKLARAALDRCLEELPLDQAGRVEMARNLMPHGARGDCGHALTVIAHATCVAIVHGHERRTPAPASGVKPSEESKPIREGHRLHDDSKKTSPGEGKVNSVFRKRRK